MRGTNRTIVPWSIISVESTVNFAECFLEVKSGKFSNVSTSLELLSSILRSAFMGHHKTTANSAVEIMVNVVSVCSVFGWHIKFVVSVPEQGESSSHDVLKNRRPFQSCWSHDYLTIPNDEDCFYPYCADCSIKDRILKRSSK